MQFGILKLQSCFGVFLVYWKTHYWTKQISCQCCFKIFSFNHLNLLFLWWSPNILDFTFFNSFSKPIQFFYLFLYKAFSCFIADGCYILGTNFAWFTCEYIEQIICIFIFLKLVKSPFINFISFVSKILQY